MTITPRPPLASFALPWDDPEAPDPVRALAGARAELGDTFGVESGGVEYLFVFGEPGLRAFYALAERDASKGLADYRMLVRKLPIELFAERRTFAHDLFGKQEVEGYLDNLDWAIGEQIAELGSEGTFDAFGLARRVGHRLALACWLGREAPVDPLIAEMDVLDGAEAFVHPERMQGASQDEERAALARVEGMVGALLAVPRTASFLDDIAARWDGAPDAVRGVAGDVVLLHVATMTNLVAALGWTLAYSLLVPSDASLEMCALEAIRLGQRSIMLREVLRPITFDDGDQKYEIDRGAQIATMLPLTNVGVGAEYDPARWKDRSLHHDVAVTTFGHGGHRCPAQRFSTSAIVRTVDRLRTSFALTPRFGRVDPLPLQIGGVGRAAEPCPVEYRAVTDLVVTRAGVEDAEWVLALRDAVSQWMLDTGIEQWRPGEFPLAYLQASFRTGEVYVAACDGVRVGAVSIEWEDPFIWGPQAEPAGYVHRLMIDRAHAGRGRGRQLLEFAEQRIAESGRAIVRLDCVRSNRPLRDYYERAGYRLIGYKGFPEMPGIPETALYEKDVDPERSRSS